MVLIVMTKKRGVNADSEISGPCSAYGFDLKDNMQSDGAQSVFIEDSAYGDVDVLEMEYQQYQMRTCDTDKLDVSKHTRDSAAVSFECTEPQDEVLCLQRGLVFRSNTRLRC